MGCKKSNRHLLNYPNLESAIRPVPHCSDLPVPIFTEFLVLYNDEDGANSEEVNDHDCEYDVDFQAMGVLNYNPSDWRLFIDSSKRSLKCVLLHNGNIFGSIPIGYSVKLKEEYNNVKEILEIINYSAHDWVICVDLKMVNFLSGQQSGFTKYPCVSLLLEQ
ncbi:hypothetical protein LOD99_13289 [Oopsacas minuta]|uniref:Uncharacterized protein n=1 Tax=Oopsacas minuta TaxID=111878 RepID=A0AAV7KJ70_9METZ|nr:hypothetical protein LOD99_13289 [Oopsacas minuta]